MEGLINSSEDRTRFIQEALSKDVLDAAFLCYYYNSFHKNWGPGEKPSDITIADIFPLLSSETVSDAFIRSAKLFKDADLPAMARLGYSEVEMTYEHALERFKDGNPGFSDDSYELALHAAMVNNR